MTMRTHRVGTYLSDAEYEDFKSVIARTGISGQTLIRMLIEGCRPKERPPKEYHQMMTELQRVGESLEQVARAAYATGFIDMVSYKESERLYTETLKGILKAVVEPEKAKP